MTGSSVHSQIVVYQPDDGETNFGDDVLSDLPALVDCNSREANLCQDESAFQLEIYDSATADRASPKKSRLGVSSDDESALGSSHVPLRGTSDETTKKKKPQIEVL